MHGISRFPARPEELRLVTQRYDRFCQHIIYRLCLFHVVNDITALRTIRTPHSIIIHQLPGLPNATCCRAKIHQNLCPARRSPMTPNLLPQQCPGMEPLHHLGLKLNSGPAGNMMSMCHRIHRMVLRDIFGSASKPTKHLTNPQLRPKHVELSNDKEVSTSRSSPWLLPKLKQVDYQRTTYCVACSGNHSSKTLGYGGPSLFIIAIS